MVKYSRTAKYEKLRKDLQSDPESDIRTNALSQYEQRLNRIAPTHFDAPEINKPEEVDPIHARRSTPYPDTEPAAKPVKEASPSNGLSKDFFKNNANYTTAFNNEYIDEYIREVKEYNVNQGNAASANTDLDILRSLKGDTPQPPRKPYQDEAIEVPASEVKKVPVSTSPGSQRTGTAVREPDTADISFFGGSRSNKPEPSSVKKKLFDDYLDDEDEPEDEPPLSDTRAMTKEDIAAEVQRLIKGSQQSHDSSRSKGRRSSYEYDDDDDGYSEDRSTRQQLLNETTQMRAQLDDYEDNLNDVNDKMKHTNQILNIVLIVLIIALSLVLAVVIYWVLLSKGIIS